MDGREGCPGAIARTTTQVDWTQLPSVVSCSRAGHSPHPLAYTAVPPIYILDLLAVRAHLLWAC
jgi:hypothetical protein